MKYHWILTLQWGTNECCHLDGTFIPVPGDTRQSTYEKIRTGALEYIRERGIRLPDAVVTVFFSLERNEL